MNKNKIALFISCAAASLSVISAAAFYVYGSYSTENDPLVTLSYVENLKNQIRDELKDTMKYEVVELNKGQIILASDSCEMILRSGSAYAYITDQANIDAGVGLSDYTSAAEITNGMPIEKNHYLIVSRPDGRGAAVTSEKAYFMIRGEYEIVTQGE